MCEMCEMCSIVRRGYLKKNVQCEVHEQIKTNTKTKTTGWVKLLKNIKYKR